MIWGSNPADSTRLGEGVAYGRFNRLISDAKRRGAKLIVIDPRRINLVDIADTWLPIEPGRDDALALAMLNVIISQELYDKEFVAQWTVGFEQLAEHVQPFTPEWAQDITKLQAGDIREVARIYATTKPALIRVGNFVDQYPNAVQTARAIGILYAITGNLDMQGGNVFFPTPTLSPLLSQRAMVKHLSADKYPLFPRVPFPYLVDAILSGEPYTPRAMIVYHANPALINADSTKTRQALEKLEFLVVCDIFNSATAELADIILPAATFFERTRLLTYSGRPSLIGGKTTSYIALAQKIVDPDGECWSDWRFWVELARKLGYKEYFPWNDIEEMIEDQLPTTGFTLEQLKNHPEGIYHGTPKIHKSYEKTGFNTPSGKVEIRSSIFERFGYDPLPNYIEPLESPISRPDLVDEYPLILFTGGKVRAYSQSSWRPLNSLRKLEPYPMIEISNETAEELEISNDEKVRVKTRRGSIEVKARLTDKILSGVVHVQHGWREGNANMLTDNSMRDPVLGCMALKTMLCKIEKPV